MTIFIIWFVDQYTHNRV